MKKMICTYNKKTACRQKKNDPGILLAQMSHFGHTQIEERAHKSDHNAGNDREYDPSDGSFRTLQIMVNFVFDQFIHGAGCPPGRSLCQSRTQHVCSSYSKRYNKFLLPALAGAVYGSSCKVEDEIVNALTTEQHGRRMDNIILAYHIVSILPSTSDH